MKFNVKQIGKALFIAFIICVIAFVIALMLLNGTWKGGLEGALDYCFDEYGEVVTWCLMIATPLFFLILMTIVFYKWLEERAKASLEDKGDKPIERI